MNMGIIQELMDIIANGYGSAPGAMDRAIAGRLLQHLEARGWINPNEVAIMVKAAGGEIRVPEQLLVEDAPLLHWMTDPMTGDMVLKSVDKDTLVKEAKVNPEAESRTVDSGPITVNPSRIVRHRHGQHDWHEHDAVDYTTHQQPIDNEEVWGERLED